MPVQISIAQAGVFGRIRIDARSVTFSCQSRIRFTKDIEVIDTAGRVLTTISVDARSGDLAALWDLTGKDVAGLEMDENSFRILLSDGSVIRSQNVLDVRQPDLAQVEFWTPAPGHYDDPPAPDQVKRYPEIIARQ